MLEKVGTCFCTGDCSYVSDCVHYKPETSDE
jgi:hypothetical protein